MKLVIDERIKNRLTGLVVIISIAVILLPTMLKKSSHRFDEKVSVSLKLPAKPPLPKVAIPNQKTLFQSVNVARVDVPIVPAIERTKAIAKAEPLKKEPSKKTVVAHAKPAEEMRSSRTSHPVSTTKATLSLASAKSAYAVQLASFVNQDNAKSLVEKLRGRGYTASYNSFKGKQGQYYQVLVGKMDEKTDALHLQKKLIQSMQLSGIIVKTNVG